LEEIKFGLEHFVLVVEVGHGLMVLAVSPADDALQFLDLRPKDLDLLPVDLIQGKEVDFELVSEFGEDLLPVVAEHCVV
jgi:hypothetical protein